MDLWSRIVGYYRPVRNWNSGRVAEFNVRRDLSKDILDLVNF
jgi:ribonucleoside-triphosphate reductase